MAVNELVHNGVTYKSLMTSSLPEDLLEKAKKEIHETEENITNGKRVLKGLLLKHNLPFSDDEEMILRALRSKKFRYKDSHEFIKNWITTFKDVKRRYGKERFFDTDIVKKVLRKPVLSFLPFRDSEGAVLLVYRPSVWMLENLPFFDTIQAACIMALFMMEVPAINLTGMVMLIDAQHFTIKEVPHFFRAMKLSYSFMKSMPGRIKKIVYVNHTSVLETIARLGTRMFPKKAQDRFVFYGDNLEEFHKAFDPVILPEELGGKAGPMTNEHWLGQLDSKRQKFLRLWNVMEEAGVI